MKRREFMGSIAVAGTFTLINPIKSISKPLNRFNDIIKPERLRQGDKIGIIAPGSFIKEDELKNSIESIEALGFKAHYTDRILERYGYLAGTDENRTEDLLEMFADSSVKGIICARGGYGCGRILSMIDYDIIKNNPKVFMGYSDITALLYAIYAKTGLVTFHGPVGTSTFNDYSVKNFTKVVMEPDDEFTMDPPEEIEDKEDPAYETYSIIDGKVEGRLAGGNLTIAVSLLATEFDVDYSNKIVFFEEIGEEPYRIDRMLTQLHDADKFDNCSGIAMGVFRKCEVKSVDPSFPTSFTLKDVIIDRLNKIKKPSIYGLSFGHITNKFTIPFGINSELSVKDKILKLIENAVI